MAPPPAGTRSGGELYTPIAPATKTVLRRKISIAHHDLTVSPGGGMRPAFYAFFTIRRAARYAPSQDQSEGRRPALPELCYVFGEGSVNQFTLARRMRSLHSGDASRGWGRHLPGATQLMGDTNG